MGYVFYGEAMIEGYIWKTDSTTYNLQILSSSVSESKQIENLFKDWSQIGFGFCKNGELINIFSKRFEDPRILNNFVRTLPVDLTEYDRNGNQKKLKTAVVKNNKKNLKKDITKQTGRICGKCGNRGHNIRTCKVSK